MDEKVADASVDESVRLVSEITISACAFLCLVTNLVYLVACYRGRNKFEKMCYYSARCLSEFSIVLAISQLAIITPTVILPKWRFDEYQDSWMYEAFCLLHNVANIGILLFVILMTIEIVFTPSIDKLLFEQRYAMELLCWSIYCLVLGHVAVATVFQSFHRFYYAQLRFYNSAIDTNDFSIMIKYFLDWERFTGLGFCFMVFWWKRVKSCRNAQSIKRNSINSFNVNNYDTRKTAPNQYPKRIEPEAITDCLFVSLLCIIPAATSSICPLVFRLSSSGNARFISGSIQCILECLPAINPFIHFYVNPKARQVLRQIFDDMNINVSLFRRSSDSIVILSP